MSEERWVIALTYPSRVISFACHQPSNLTTRLKDARVWGSYAEAKHEREMIAARLQPMKRRRISVITHDEAVVRLTARTITDG